MTCYKHYTHLSQHCGQQVLFALIQIKAGSELRAGINIVTLLALSVSILEKCLEPALFTHSQWFGFLYKNPSAIIKIS